MKKFIGTKLVSAKPMTRGDYNVYRNWILPLDEDGSDEGYLVEYLDGGKPNHPDHVGYISWSPKEQFNKAYSDVTQGITFSVALSFIKAGHKLARAGWNGKGMFIFLVNGSQFTVNRPPLLGIYPEGTIINYHAHIDMRTADGTIVPWLCSQTDMLADDWEIL